MSKSNFNPIVSEYIAKSAEFAQPILIELRSVVHSYCPDVNESMKWSFPFFNYNGSILCSMASFKQHCAFGFWLESQLIDEQGIFKRSEGGMGTLGKLTSIEDIPSFDKLGALISQAMLLIDQGVKLNKQTPKTIKQLVMPTLLVEALDKDPLAKSVFDNFSPSHKREYADWINEAKTEVTRIKRLETTLSNLRENKSKEWKYKK